MDQKQAAGDDVESFHRGNFKNICNRLARLDPALATILQGHGYPPMWTRPPGFATLVYIILEQQVSLASAKAAFLKLNEKLVVVSPENLIRLTDEELRACYFSRQKTIYVRHLANAILDGSLDPDKLATETEQVIRQQLKRIKGIGDWTTDIYLIFALQRPDIFPVGDLAMVNAMKEVKSLPHHVSKEDLVKISMTWSPYRSVATMLLWHYYIQKRGIKI